MGKPTPGPWALKDDFGLEVFGADDQSLMTSGRETSELFANARLIAASPDLLNALTGLADAAEKRGIPCDAARAAIAKATGATP